MKFRYADVCCITIKPVFMNNFRLFLACLAIFAVFVSCEDERYDLSQGVDLTVSIGGDSLALPIGTTSSISLKSLMDSYGGNAGADDYIKVLEDGTYAFMMSGQESFGFDQISSGGLSMDDYSVSSSIDIAITEGLQSGYASEIPPLYIDFDEVLDFSMSIDDVPGQIESLDSIILSSAYIDVDLYLENLPDLGADGKISVKAGMTIPESLILDGMSGNYYYVDEPLSEDGRLNVRIPVRGLRIGDIENGAITFNETVGLAGSFILENVSIDHGELIGREVTLGYSALFGNIMPTDVYGKFNYSIDDYNVSVDIGNSLPDFMKGDDVVLDFSNPFLLLSLNTNISIPFEASMNLTPFVGESPNVDGIQEISMKMKASQFKATGYERVENHLYINTGAGRQWRFHSVDISSDRGFANVDAPVEITHDTDGIDDWGVRADKATYADGLWWLHNPRFIYFDVDGSELPESAVSSPPLPSVFPFPELTETPHDMLIGVRDWMYLGSRDMLRILRTTGGTPEKWFDFWYSLAAPWTCIVITLFAIPAGITTSRQSVFKGVSLVLITFFSFYGFTLVLEFFGQHGVLYPFLAAWLPNLVFLAIGLGLYRRLT